MASKTAAAKLNVHDLIFAAKLSRVASFEALEAWVQEADSKGFAYDAEAVKTALNRINNPEQVTAQKDEVQQGRTNGQVPESAKPTSQAASEYEVSLGPKDNLQILAIADLTGRTDDRRVALVFDPYWGSEDDQKVEVTSGGNLRIANFGGSKMATGKRLQELGHGDLLLKVDIIRKDDVKAMQNTTQNQRMTQQELNEFRAWKASKRS